MNDCIIVEYCIKDSKNLVARKQLCVCQVFDRVASSPQCYQSPQAGVSCGYMWPLVFEINLF